MADTSVESTDRVDREGGSSDESVVSSVTSLDGGRCGGCFSAHSCNVVRLSFAGSRSTSNTVSPFLLPFPELPFPEPRRASPTPLPKHLLQSPFSSSSESESDATSESQSKRSTSHSYQLTYSTGGGGSGGDVGGGGGVVGGGSGSMLAR